MSQLLVVVLVGVGTYLERSLLVIAAGRFGIPPLAERTLRYVPPAVLGALIAPAVISPNGHVEFSARWFAAALAAATAWRTRNIAATITVGLGALLIAQAIF